MIVNNVTMGFDGVVECVIDESIPMDIRYANNYLGSTLWVELTLGSSQNQACSTLHSDITVYKNHGAQQ